MNKKNFNRLIEISSSMIPQKAKNLKELHCNKTILIHLIQEESNKAQIVCEIQRKVKDNEREIQL